MRAAWILSIISAICFAISALFFVLAHQPITALVQVTACLAQGSAAFFWHRLSKRTT